MANFLGTPRERLGTLPDPPARPPAIDPLPRRRSRLPRALGRGRVLRAGLLALLAVAVVVAALVGREVGRDDPARPASLGTARVLGGHVALSGWAGWLPARPSRAAAALLPDAKTVTPVTLDGVTVLVGDVGDRGVSRLLRGLRTADGPGEELVAGDLRARLVTGTFRGRHQRPSAALLVPSSEGVSAVVCLGDTRRSTSAASDCMTVLTTTVSLRGAAPAAASPGRADATRMRTVVRELNASRRRDAAMLAAASSSGRQANAALALSRDYGRAARGMRSVGATSLAAGSLADVRAAIRAAAGAFEAMSRAADAGSARRFRAARASALAAEARLRRAVAELGVLGYAGR